MSVASDVAPARTTVVTPTPAPAKEVVCETALSWLHTPPTTALGWDAPTWEEAQWAIAVHGIAPLLYHRLHSTPTWNYFAPELRQWLTEQYAWNEERICRIKAELEALLAVANAATITIVPLKGSAALYSLYTACPALRPMADIDLLVRPADEATFTHIIRAQGYLDEEHTPRHRTFTHPTARKVVSTRGEHPDNPRGIQVHTEINELFWGSRYDVTEALWQGEIAPFGNAQGWRSDPVGFMQHLLMHASADVLAGKARLIRLYDVALLAPRFTEAMWALLAQSALQKGEARWLYVALRLVMRYLQVDVPAAPLHQLAEATPIGLRNFVEKSTLYHLSFCNPLRLSLQERLLWHKPGWERMVAIWYCLFPTPTQLREYHPELTTKGQYPLAYLRHLGLMVDGYRRTLFHMPRRSWLRREQGGK